MHIVISYHRTTEPPKGSRWFSCHRWLVQQDHRWKKHDSTRSQCLDEETSMHRREMGLLNPDSWRVSRNSKWSLGYHGSTHNSYTLSEFSVMMMISRSNGPMVNWVNGRCCSVFLLCVLFMKPISQSSPWSVRTGMREIERQREIKWIVLQVTESCSSKQQLRLHNVSCPGIAPRTPSDPIEVIAGGGLTLESILT